MPSQKETKKYSSYPFSGVNSLLVSGRVPTKAPISHSGQIHLFWIGDRSARTTRVWDGVGNGGETGMKPQDLMTQ